MFFAYLSSKTFYNLTNSIISGVARVLLDKFGAIVKPTDQPHEVFELSDFIINNLPCET